MTPAASAEPLTCRLVRVKGLNIHTQVGGQGEPLLLHSGVFTGAQSWDALLPHLAEYRIIAFDPPGIGRSSTPAYPLTMRALATVGAALLDELGVESAHVLGLSFGGAVAQQMALSYPSRVRRLVLASTVFGSPGIPGDALALWHFLQSGHYSRERLEQTAGIMFGGRLRTEPELIHTLRIRRPPDTRAALNRLTSLFGWSSLPWLWAIRHPALILCGDDDPITPLINHQIMAALMPNARLEVVRGGGHLMLLDSAARVSPLMTRFLRAGATSAAPVPSGSTPMTSHAYLGRYAGPHQATINRGEPGWRTSRKATRRRTPWAAISGCSGSWLTFPCVSWPT